MVKNPKMCFSGSSNVLTLYSYHHISGITITIHPVTKHKDAFDSQQMIYECTNYDDEHKCRADRIVFFIFPLSLQGRNYCISSSVANWQSIRVTETNESRFLPATNRKRPLYGSIQKQMLQSHLSSGLCIYIFILVVFASARMP